MNGPNDHGDRCGRSGCNNRVNDMDKPTPPEPVSLSYDIENLTVVKGFTKGQVIAHGEAMAAWGAAQERERPLKTKLWIWENFVDGRPEFWAFDNPFPIHLGDNGDPQTLGEPVGYALFKPSRTGRADVPEHEILRRIKAAHQGD